MSRQHTLFVDVDERRIEMLKPPGGWQLMLVDGQGVVRDEIAIGGYNLDKPFAREVLISTIFDMLRREVTNAKKKRKK